MKGALIAGMLRASRRLQYCVQGFAFVQVQVGRVYVIQKTKSFLHFNVRVLFFYGMMDLADLRAAKGLAQHKTFIWYRS